MLAFTNSPEDLYKFPATPETHNDTTYRTTTGTLLKRSTPAS